MAIKSQTTKIIICICINVAILIVLYSIPVEGNPLLENLCIFKSLFGEKCFNCGMTRSFLSILHGNFDMAMYYNKNVVIVFPFTVIIYLFSWYKYISKKI